MAQAVARRRIPTRQLKHLSYNPESRTEKSKLKLLRMMMACEHPEAVKKVGQLVHAGLETWEADLLAELRRLPKGQREKLLLAYRSMIDAVAGKPGAVVEELLFGIGAEIAHRDLRIRESTVLQYDVTLGGGA